MPFADVVVGFLLGVLGAGFGAVVQRYISDRALDDRLRRGLLAEIDENLERVYEGAGGPGRARLVRTAWDAARQVEWPRRDVFSAIADAYIAADVANHFWDRVDAMQDDFSDEALNREHERIERTINWIESHGKVRHYFRRARRALSDGVVEPRPDASLWEGKRPAKTGPSRDKS